jgi:hypothetical protein
MWIEQGLTERRDNAHRATHFLSPRLSLAACADAPDDHGSRSQRDPVAGVELGSGGVEEAVLDDVGCQRCELLRSAQSARIGEKLDLSGGGLASGHVQDRRVEAASDDGVDADAATGKTRAAGSVMPMRAALVAA